MVDTRSFRSRSLRAVTALLGVGASGCLIGEAPDYTEPRQTPPFLLLNQAEPPITAIFRAVSGVDIEFNVPVRSEDLGDELVASLVLDYRLEGENQLASVRGDAGTFFGERQRSISVVWDTGQTLGCHQVTMIVTHFSNADSNFLPIDPADQALATWWVALRSPVDPENLPLDCPRPAPLSNSGDDG